MIVKSPVSYSLWENLPETGKETAQLKSAPETAPKELWLAIDLPRLALEVIVPETASTVSVIVEEKNSRQIVHLASARAEQLGVVSGMPLANAYILCPNLQVHNIDMLAQQQRLQQLASWALQFSPRISLSPPCSLLVEIAGNIKYFGKAEIIREQINKSLKQRWNHVFNLAVSPSPGASLLLAKSATHVIVEDSKHLRSVLGQLSIAFLPLDKKCRQQLEKTGVSKLRDIWRLPSAALARRFGIELVQYLDRVLGKLPTPLPGFCPPTSFQQLHEIPYEIHNYQLLLPYADRLLTNLCDFLRSSDMYTNEFSFYLQHHRHVPTVITLSLRRPLRDNRHFLMLLKTKLEQGKLTAPVIAIKLVAKTLHPYTTKTPDLFSSRYAGDANGNIETLLEQLHARIGYDAIQGISFHADHRPEYAGLNSSLEIRSYPPSRKNRPLWLLPVPKKLIRKNNHLYYKSIIRFSMGPERIESGWWDGVDIRRDYYIGIDDVAGSLWIYHDLKDGQFWYLHGLFG